MTTKPMITIKGLRDGLVFLLDDKCEFIDLLTELRDKLEHTPHFFDGPVIYVDVKLGIRSVTDEQKTEIVNVLRQQGNLLIRSIQSINQQSENGAYQVAAKTGVVRSGQVLHYDGNLLFSGDVNPGGKIICTGDVYVLGALRGIVYAGFAHNQSAIIGAALFAPMQLRIGEIISRPPEQWGLSEAHIEFAYVHEGIMKIDKISQLHRVRKDIGMFKGV